LSRTFSAAAQSQQPPSAQQPASTSTDRQVPNEQPSGSISGTVVDQTGAVVARAQVTLTREDQSLDDRVLSGDDGQFSFSNVPAGPFHLTIGATGFATQAISGTLHSGELYIVPQIALALATSVTEVRVTPSSNEVAEEQLKAQEKQRVLGFVPKC
jgi:Carboxypeptidase regulatory-like domain